MTFIRTLNGDISPAELGTTYSHDHLFCIPPYWEDQGKTDLLLDDYNASFAELLDFKRAGGNAIYDATAPDYGRKALTVAQMAKDANVHIIGTAGFNKGFLWSSEKPNSNLSFERYIAQCSIDILSQDVINEIVYGIEGSEHKAGVVLMGLLLQQKSFSDVVVGTLKGILGFLIIGAGAGIIVQALLAFQPIWTEVFGLNAMTLEGIVGQESFSATHGSSVTLAMAIGFGINLFLARVTKFKYVYLTGHMMFWTAMIFAGITVNTVADVPAWKLTIFLSVILGLYWTFQPAITQPFMRKVKNWPLSIEH